MQFLYDLAISIYLFAIRVASIFSKKAKQWVLGRNMQANRLEKLSLIKKSKKRIWFHCASLGEFEQGRPIIESLKSKYNVEIILTFFSPSGFEIRKDYEKADYIFYLPIDKKKQVKKFLDSVNVDVAIFIKYEFWYNYIQELRNRSIPIYLVSGIFRENQHFFKFYGEWFKEQLKHFEFFFLQNQKSAHLIESIGLYNYQINGDTRFDQVFKTKQSNFYDEIIESFVKDGQVIVFGSSWRTEDNLAKQLITTNHDLKIILAPHEVNDQKKQKLLAFFNDEAQLYSSIKEKSQLKSRVLILDTVGLLSKVYRYATISVIGGGFGKGIHNTIEAAVYGKPTLFGPNYHKFNEAVQLIKLGGAFSFKNEKEFFNLINQLLSDNFFYNKASELADHYCRENLDATKKIVDYLSEKRLLR